jgi:hypothetical protein
VQIDVVCCEILHLLLAIIVASHEVRVPKTIVIDGRILVLLSGDGTIVDAYAVLIIEYARTCHVYSFVI